MGSIFGRLAGLFEWFGHEGRAGYFIMLSTLGAAFYAGAYHAAYLPGGDGSEGSPPLLTILLLAGLVLVVFSFVSAGRSRAGRWPTMPMVAFAYVFVVTIVRILLGVVEGTGLLDVPGFLVYAARGAIYWDVFVLGWVLGYGTPRGWNRREIDPGFGVRRLFGKAPAMVAGADEEEKPKPG